MLHVITPARFGGLERVVHSLAGGQVQAGCRVSVAAIIEPDSTEPELLGQLRAAGADVHRIALAPRAYVSQIRSLAQVVRRLRPDVVHSHGYVADVFIALLGGRVAPPVVTTAHGFTGGGRKNQLYEWMQRRAFRRFAAVVGVSAKLGRELIADGIAAERVHVIPNAFARSVDLPSLAAARADLHVPVGAFSIGWVGRISHEKGLDVLIEALPNLDIADWHLTVLGDGSSRSSSEAKVSELGLNQRVTFAGALPNAGRLVPAFDVIVVSSRTEGTPITLFEAMDAAVPIVATAVGGIPDVLPADAALLVPSENPGALAAAISSVAGDRAAARQRAARAHDRLDSFAVGPFVARYDAVYDEVIRAYSAR